MPEPRSSTAGFRQSATAVAATRQRIATVAERQWGSITRAQAVRRGVSDHALARAVGAGWLFGVYPAVYSIVPTALMTPEAWHAAAILAGGEGACLCGASGGWWMSVWKTRPALVHVAIEGKREPQPGIRWHRLRLAPGERGTYNRMPVTSPARVALDMAAGLSLWDLKGLLADLEFHHDVHPDDVREVLRRGFRGAAKLRRALDEHTPQLAATRSELERTFVRFLADRGFEMADFNHPAGTTTVDAIFRRAGVVVELDGARGHAGERRILRDHRRDLHRRADGLLPLRYHYTQLVTPADQVLIEAELERFGVRRLGSAA